ncbi:MAG: hypothetical protein M1346_01200 [Gammaproteobacteria bacterium]|nr:hypothetical protein [Gammaproteobacteria bacterium]
MTTTETHSPWTTARHGTKSVRFIIADTGKAYTNDRYTIIFDNPLNNGGNRGTTYPYIALNSIGMGYHGEVDPAYVESILEGDISGEELIGWGNLSKECRAAARAEIRSYLDL